MIIFLGFGIFEKILCHFYLEAYRICHKAKQIKYLIFKSRIYYVDFSVKDAQQKEKEQNHPQ